MLGGDRQMVMLVFLIGIIMVYAARDFIVAAAMILLCAGALLGLRAMAREDPYMIPIFIRSRRMIGCAAVPGSITGDERPVI